MNWVGIAPPLAEAIADGTWDGSFVLTASDRDSVEELRKTIEDAILSVIGTLLMVGVALVWFGMLVTVSAYDTSPIMALAGVFVILVGVYQAASTLGIIPTVTDLL